MENEFLEMVNEYSNPSKSQGPICIALIPFYHELIGIRFHVKNGGFLV